MTNLVHAGVVASLAASLVFAGGAAAQAPAGMGQEEFGLTERDLAQRVEKVEQLIAECMRAQGFEYVAVDYKTVRRATQSDKTLPGLDEDEFIEKYGFGISTLYTGRPPQLATGYSLAKMALGTRNVETFQGLSPADQVAYSRALTGSFFDATFAEGLESEDLTRCGGCTRQAIELVFDEEELAYGYYNPLDALIAADPRMREAIRKYVQKMQKAGFIVESPDTVEREIRERLDAITGAGTVPVEQFSQEQKLALETLQDYERRLAITNLEIEEKIVEPVEERVEKELFARRVE